MAMHTESIELATPDSESLQIGHSMAESTEEVKDIGLDIVIQVALSADSRGEFEETGEDSEAADTAPTPTELAHNLSDIEMEETDPIEPPTSHGSKRGVDELEGVEEFKGKIAKMTGTDKSAWHPFFTSDASRVASSGNATKHSQAKSCSVPPPPKPMANNLAKFLVPGTRPKPKEQPQKISKPLKCVLGKQTKMLPNAKDDEQNASQAKPNPKNGYTN
ncbi:hypothetical protein C8F04DRAFT_1295045 [Mycena alexandri]|uniref:Uncharacterized protein n=1 Tax=Mycena alexandri TaxID=1745969 RepID=A0AAD6TD48_9AGAR|nr:hypothetical protein C8F04DRAFT_1295045 [Mycena alexandri]